MSKKRIIKDYDQMPREVLVELKARFPDGYHDHLLRFNNANGESILALPFETEEIFYLVRMNGSGGYHIIEEDLEDDFDGLSDTDGLEFDQSEE